MSKYSKKGGSGTEKWFVGGTPVFLTANCTPLQRVYMDDFNKDSEFKIKPGDLRKRNTTTLAHDIDPVSQLRSTIYLHFVKL